MSPQNDRRKPEEIEDEIHQTRARLDDTLHELEERFSPQQLMNTTYDYLRNGGANDFVASLGRTVKENPLPVMVTGIGLGWLVLSQRKSNHGHSQGYSGQRQAGYPGSTIPQSPGMPRDPAEPGSVSGAGTTAMGHDPAALGATTRHSGSAGGGDDSGGHGMTHKAQQMAGQMKQRAQHMGDTLRDRASHAQERMPMDRESLSHSARGAGSQTTHFIQEHPLVAGALGVAIGAALGGMFSPTRVENEHMGSIRDRALHKAAETGQEQAERVQETIHEKAEQAKSQSQSGGGDAASRGGASSAGGGQSGAKSGGAGQSPAGSATASTPGTSSATSGSQPSAKGSGNVDPEADNNYSSRPGGTPPRGR